MELLKKHRSIRSYKDLDIPMDILNEILECGIRASNTGNMQLYSVIVTKELENKNLLAPFHFNQPMIKNAPVILTICFDINRFYKWCFINNAVTDFKNLLWLLNGTIDASILIQNICIAAENQGLGICYLGTTLYNASEISAILNLPDGVIPITALSLGYPDIIPEITDRLSLEAIIHIEKYGDYDENKIRKIYEEKEKLETSVRFVNENQKENLAQVYTEVRYSKADSNYFSKKLIALLKQQGFTFE